MIAANDRARRAVMYALLATSCACFSPNPPSGSPCADDSRCPKGQLCVQGFCSGAAGGGIGVDTPPAVPMDAAIDAAPDAPPVMCIVPEDCPNPNPCVTVDCVANKCVVAANLADGTSCGPTEAERCCSGTCVDISIDEANCGGCGQQCATGRMCESVALTTQCGTRPPTTSGRCTCAGASSECPDGQVCRTQTPAANRCAPENVGDCAADQMFVDVAQCPNFCKYP